MLDCPDDLRLVINFSYGCTGGRHDGETELEAAIDELIRKRREYAPTALVLAAGKTRFSTACTQRFMTPLHRNSVVELPWRIQPTTGRLAISNYGSGVSSVLPGRFDFTIELRDPSGAIADCATTRPVNVRTSLPVGADHPTGEPGDPIRVLAVLNPQGDVIGQISADLTGPTQRTARPSLPLNMNSI